MLQRLIFRKYVTHNHIFKERAQDKFVHNLSLNYDRLFFADRSKSDRKLTIFVDISLNLCLVPIIVEVYDLATELAYNSSILKSVFLNIFFDDLFLEQLTRIELFCIHLQNLVNSITLQI